MSCSVALKRLSNGTTEVDFRVVFFVQLELGNMAKSGELKEIWDVAAKTNIQFNMVCDVPACVLPRCCGQGCKALYEWATMVCRLLSWRAVFY
jgi:hypothetical protein